jgi:hypothetical protein
MRADAALVAGRWSLVAGRDFCRCAMRLSLRLFLLADFCAMVASRGGISRFLFRGNLCWLQLDV